MAFYGKFGAGFLTGRLPPGRREQELSFFPVRENRSRALGRTRTKRVRARLGESTNTVRDLPAAGALLAGLTALRAANRRLAWETPEKPRSKAQLFGRFCAWGNGWPHVLHIHGSLARAFARRIFSLSQGTGAKLFPCPGKQKPCAGAHLKKNRVRARLGESTNTVRDLPAAGALLAGLTALRAANRRLAWETPEKPKEQSSSFSGVSVRGGTFGPTFYVFMKVWRRLLPGGFPPGRREQEMGFLSAGGNRSPAWACTQK